MALPVLGRRRPGRRLIILQRWLKVYLYGYLNRIQSADGSNGETQRNIELMWLTGRLMPDFKTIADFAATNRPRSARPGAQFVMLCRQLNLFTPVCRGG